VVLQAALMVELKRPKTKSIFHKPKHMPLELKCLRHLQQLNLGFLQEQQQLQQQRLQREFELTWGMGLSSSWCMIGWPVHMVELLAQRQGKIQAAFSLGSR
jgi:hypothetical protein